VNGFRPETIGLVQAWGPEWIPLVAGAQGAFVAESLGSVDRTIVRPRSISVRLRRAGTDGLHGLRRHGERLLRTIAETGRRSTMCASSMRCCPSRRDHSLWPDRP